MKLCRQTRWTYGFSVKNLAVPKIKTALLEGQTWASFLHISRPRRSAVFPLFF